jgi:ribosomal-protein-alanine N-acetyltransferase
MGRARVALVRPSARWSAEFVAAVRRSRRLHGRWVRPPSTPTAYRAYVRRLRRPTYEGYLICLRDSDELVGVENISEIVQGALRSAYLGYYVFRPYEGRELMTEGLALVVRDAFRRLGLPRVEANIQPGNRAPIRLARRLGFRREGYSPRYLKIQGRWRDHERWALLAARP